MQKVKIGSDWYYIVNDNLYRRDGSPCDVVGTESKRRDVAELEASQVLNAISSYSPPLDTQKLGEDYSNVQGENTDASVTLSDANSEAVSPIKTDSDVAPLEALENGSDNDITENNDVSTSEPKV